MGSPLRTDSPSLRALTFWLRPAFVLRSVNRFQRLAGFDRAVGLAASALTALIPLALVAGAIAAWIDGRDLAQRIIDRYELTGGGAEAVRDALSPAAGNSVDVGIFGLLLLIVAVLSFTRAAQRLVEQTWELPSLSIRNSANGLLWVAGLGAFVLLSGWIRTIFDGFAWELIGDLVLLPAFVAFLTWSGWMLSGKRLQWERLLPFAAIAAVLLTAYSVAADIYLPHLFSSYATRYGVIGAAFAMIAALFGVMLAIVAAAAAGREFGDELERVRRGERPPDEEVRREWDAVVTEARAHWAALRQRRRRRPAAADQPDGATGERSKSRPRRNSE